jgi:hypothetical protein
MIRINKLAKDLGFTNSVLIEKCQECGFVHITHHANALTDEQVDLLRSKLIGGAGQSVSVKERPAAPKVEKISAEKKDAGSVEVVPKVEKVSTEKKDAGSVKVVSKEAEAAAVRRRIPLWKQKAREDLIKGRWKEITKVTQQKRPRRFEKRTKEAPKEQKAVQPKEKESKVAVELPATVKDVSAAFGVKSGDIISKMLIDHNICATSSYRNISWSCRSWKDFFA